jgi:hypothetical protein
MFGEIIKELGFLKEEDLTRPSGNKCASAVSDRLKLSLDNR